MSSQIDFIQYKFEHLKQYFIYQNRSTEVLDLRKLCEIAIRT